MEPIALTHLQGKAILRNEVITVERGTGSRSTSQQIPLSKISAVHHISRMMGGAVSISLQIDDATTVELRFATPAPAARQFIATIESYLTNHAAATPAIIEGSADDVEPDPVAPLSSVASVAPVTPAPQPAPQIVVVVAPPAPLAPPEQMIKIYRGADCAKQFQKDAKKLARKGWRVQSQNYGGQKNKAAAVLLLGPLGFATGSKPGEMTVVYVRN